MFKIEHIKQLQVASTKDFLHGTLFLMQNSLTKTLIPETSVKNEVYKVTPEFPEWYEVVLNRAWLRLCSLQLMKLWGSKTAVLNFQPSNTAIINEVL